MRVVDLDTIHEEMLIHFVQLETADGVVDDPDVEFFAEIGVDVRTGDVECHHLAGVDVLDLNDERDPNLAEVRTPVTLLQVPRAVALSVIHPFQQGFELRRQRVHQMQMGWVANHSHFV